MNLNPRPGGGFGRPTHSRKMALEDRPFIAWDGEGINLRGPGRPQAYVLFGSSENHISSKTGLNAFDCLEHIVQTGEAHPGAIHVGFAFSYDANMIVQSLSPVTLARLHVHGLARLKRANGDLYAITFLRGKFFRVTKYKSNYHPKANPHAKTTVTIYDIFSFFASSFVVAYENMLGPISTVISAGKAARGEFSLDQWDEVVDYWTLEIQLLRDLADELRDRVYDAGLKISQWHGPGALASYALREHSIRDEMEEAPEEVRLASRYAYAGGRFELFKLGTRRGRIFGIDINSAYPFAISQLPSLAAGHWSQVVHPNSIERFGVYHIRMNRGQLLDEAVSPVFHRDKDHTITFPWVVDTWVWSPEAYWAQKCGADILEGWVFQETHRRPFAWVADMYEQRREWKRTGISAQIALKLCMNSIYGKLAQRVGWDPIHRRMPPFHQLEWAGWITSFTRARLFDIMSRVPFEAVIAVETDGLYTSADPATLGIHHSEELGGWSVAEYDEIMYVQSGLAWLHGEDKWTSKRRGLDPCRKGHRPEECDCEGVFNLQACRGYLSSLHPNPTADAAWRPYKGKTTRFTGLGVALKSRLGVANKHCVWSTDDREISPALTGKRIHVSACCRACRVGCSAAEEAHDLMINSRAVREPGSYPHSIPWEAEVGHARWRDFQDGLDDEEYVE